MPRIAARRSALVRVARVPLLGAAWFACAGFAFAGGGDATPLRFATDLPHSLAATTVAVPSATSAPATTRAGSPARPVTPGGHGASPGAPAGGHAAGSGLVSRNGTSLMVNGSPWQFAGYDDYRLTSASPGYQCGGPLSDAEVGASLDEMRSQSGATVVRTWFMQSYGGPGNWTQLDRVVSAAAARGMKVIPVLADQWAACEPLPSHYRSLSWYQSGYKEVDPGYTLSYRDYAAAIAAHYRGNPTIAFWQLVNEAEALDYAGGPCQDAAANSALRAFADDVAGVLKTTDPGHLVSLGTIGTGQCGTSSTSDYLNLHAGRIDLCEYHDYFGPGGMPGDQWHGVAVRISQCHSLNKPIFAGEVGLPASITADGSSGGTVTAQTLLQRAVFFQQKLQAQFGAGISGFLVWQYATGPRTDGFEVQPGDPTERVIARAAGLLAHGGA